MHHDYVAPCYQTRHSESCAGTGNFDIRFHVVELRNHDHLFNIADDGLPTSDEVISAFLLSQIPEPGITHLKFLRNHPC